MTTKETLLAEIAANPDDVAVRLVFADWCEDVGDTDRAEFIRAQVRLEEMPEYDPDRLDLEERALDLLAAHRAEWLAGLPAWARREPVVFRRGLPGEMRLTPGKFLSHGDKLTRAAPLIRLTLAGLPDRAGDLAASEATKRLAELEIVGAAPDELRSRGFFRQLRSETLRHLGIDGRTAHVNDVSALTEWRGLGRLTSLSLRRMQFPDGCLAGLLGARNLTRLQSLDLPMTGIDVQAVRTIVRLTGLRSLTLYGLSSGDEGARALAGADWALRHLNLTANSGEAGVRDLSRAPWFAGLRSLDVSGAPAAEALASLPPGLARLGLHYGDRRAACAALFASDLAAGLTDLTMRLADGEVVSDLAAAPRLARLTRLRFSSAYEHPDLLCDVIESPHLTSLRELSVYNCMLSPEGQLRLPRLAGLSRLRSLSLANCWLTDEGLAALARSPHLNGLRRLDLSGNSYGTAGLKVLLQAPWLPSLRELRLGGSQVNWVGIEALANCAALANLRLLELNQHSVGERAAAPLAESPYLGGLLRLVLSGGRPLRSAVERLRERFGGVLEVE